MLVYTYQESLFFVGKIMWQDEILKDLYKIREEHAKSFNYDLKVIFAD
jgi:hypothetical protein